MQIYFDTRDWAECPRDKTGQELYWKRNCGDTGYANIACMIEELQVKGRHYYLGQWGTLVVPSLEALRAVFAVVDAALSAARQWGGYYAQWDGSTLLHWAARMNQIWPLQKFLDDPACAIDAKCFQGKTALDWAIAAGAKESIEILRNHPKQQAIDAAEAKARIEAEAKAQAEAAAKAKADENTRLAAEKATVVAEAKAKAELVEARQAILDHFQCPITTQLMYEPVLAADGESYEKEVIEAWLTSRNTSPLSNEVLAHQHLTPNKNIKRAIDELLDKYPVLRETGDYYLAKSLIQQAINAVERGDAKTLEQLVNSHFGLVTDNLHKVIALPKPKIASSSSSSSCSEPVEEAESIQPDPIPVYLLNVIAEKGDAACLNVAIKRMGAAFKELVLKQTQNNPDGLLQRLAKRQAKAAIELLTEALGYTSEDYLRLMRSHHNVDGMRGLWLEYYLKAHQESPEVVLAKMLTEVSVPKAVATLKMAAIRLDTAVLYSFAARCIKEGLLAELQTLATLGLSLQTVDAKGNNLLHLAAEHNQKEIALWLLAEGVSEKDANHAGQRPRDIAKTHQHHDLSNSLIRQHQAQKLSFFVQPLQAKVEELQQSLVLSQAQSQAKIAELENSLALSQSKLFKLESSMLAASGIAKEADLESSVVNPTSSMTLGPK